DLVSVHRELDGVIGENQRVNELPLGELAGGLGALQRLARRLVELGNAGVVLADPRLRFLDLRLNLVDSFLRRGATVRNLLGDEPLGRESGQPEDSEK